MEQNEKNMLFAIVGLFLLFYFMPAGQTWFDDAVLAGVSMLHDYAVLHILTCLVPAFFIAGALNTFVPKELILAYLSSKSKKAKAYAIASVSGAVLAVCSCTILPIFAGIYKRGAGIGPATTFLFSGPAINIAAMFLTFSVLGFDIGIARVVGAIFISILVGLFMDMFFKQATSGNLVISKAQQIKTPSKTISVLMALLVCILVVNGLQFDLFVKTIVLVAISILVFAVGWFFVERSEFFAWLNETLGFTKMLMPILFVGVFISGFVLPLIPSDLVQNVAGENTIWANLFASIIGAFMYFSTLTEVPILQALMANGLNHGPALALLLAGPSLSLPSLLVIRHVLGNVKTFAYVGLIIIFSALAGFIFGAL